MNVPSPNRIKPGYTQINPQIPAALKRDALVAMKREHTGSLTQFVINALRDRIRKSYPDAPSIKGDRGQD